MKPKICVSITGRDLREIKAFIRKAENNQADLIEIRFDYIAEEIDIREIRKATRKPLIATHRPIQEGGLFAKPVEARVKTLISAAKNNFNYIDIELLTPNLTKIVDEIKKENNKILISFHNYSDTPPIQYFFKIMDKMASFKADVFKIVTTAKTYEDNLIPLNFIINASKKRNVISFCMGSHGILSRLLSPIIGGALTYASVESGYEAASGQIPIRIMKQIYELMNL